MKFFRQSQVFMFILLLHFVVLFRMPLNLILQFSGGSEILFEGKKEHKIQLPESDSKIIISNLLDWILVNFLSECDRSDLLIVGGTVRPGILVLVNDTDWELLGGVCSY